MTKIMKIIMKKIMKIVKRIKKKKFLSLIFFGLFLRFVYQLVYENEEVRKNAIKSNKFKNAAMENAKKRSKEFRL